MTKTLTLHQPWASLVALGVKRIETRSWATKHRGRLLIHAGAKVPAIGAYCDGAVAVGWESRHVWRALGDDAWDVPLPLPLGSIVASCTLADVVPMVDAASDEHTAAQRTGGGYVVLGPGYMALRTWDPIEWDESITDQRPYGDFAPGRFAWLLSDVKPTTERCPAYCERDDEDGYYRVQQGGSAEVGGGRLSAWITCPTCDGAGACDPVPARGRQQLWEWTP